MKVKKKDHPYILREKNPLSECIYEFSKTKIKKSLFSTPKRIFGIFVVPKSAIFKRGW